MYIAPLLAELRSRVKRMSYLTYAARHASNYIDVTCTDITDAKVQI